MLFFPLGAASGNYVVGRVGLAGVVSPLPRLPDLTVKQKQAQALCQALEWIPLFVPLSPEGGEFRYRNGCRVSSHVMQLLFQLISEC